MGLLDTLEIRLKTTVDKAGISSLQGGLRDLRTDLNEFAEGMVGIGNSISNITRSVTQTVTEFELSQNRIKGVFLDRINNAERTMFERQARMLGRETSRTASDAAAAQLHLARAGLDPCNRYTMLSLLHSTWQSQVNLKWPAASQLVHKQMRAFRLPAEEASRVADVLAHIPRTPQQPTFR